MIIDWLPNFCNPAMKSIEMSVHMVSRMGKGSNAHGGFIVSPFYCWQFSHFSKKVHMSLLKPS
jgi:hypothetical protein